MKLDKETKLKEINKILESDNDILDVTYISLNRIHDKTTIIDYKKKIVDMLSVVKDKDVLRMIYELLAISA